MVEDGGERGRIKGDGAGGRRGSGVENRRPGRRTHERKKGSTREDGFRRNGRKVGDDEVDWMTANDPSQPHQTDQIPQISLLGVTG